VLITGEVPCVQLASPSGFVAQTTLHRTSVDETWVRNIGRNKKRNRAWFVTSNKTHWKIGKRNVRWDLLGGVKFPTNIADNSIFYKGYHQETSDPEFCFVFYLCSEPFHTSTYICTDAIATLALLEMEPHAKTSMNAAAWLPPVIRMPSVQTHLVASRAHACLGLLETEWPSVNVSSCYSYGASISCRFHNLSICTSRPNLGS